MAGETEDQDDLRIPGVNQEAVAEPDPTLTWAQDWRPEARSYLQRLAGHLGKREVSDHSATVPIGKAKLLIVGEEVELVNALTAGNEPKDLLKQLLLDGVGLRVKLLASVKSVDTSATPETEAAARQELAADFEHVKELGSELQAMVSQLSKAGDLEAAKVVAEHRRRFLTIRDIAEKAVPGVTSGGAAAPTLVTGAGPQEHDAKASAAAKARHLAKQKKQAAKSAQVKMVANAAKLGLVAVGLGIVLGLGVVYLQVRQPDLPTLSLEDVRSVPGVIQVIPRPPAVLVIVSDEAWNRMSTPERRTAMESIVATARAAGYSAAEIRSPSRQGLGQWDGGGNVEIAP